MANLVKVKTNSGFEEISYTRIADGVQFARVNCNEDANQPVSLTVQGPTKTNMLAISKSYIGLWDTDNSKWIWQIDVPVYPVGAVYMSSSSTSPASLFGGTWTPIQNRFLIGAGAGYQTMKTGGESTHTLTESEMPRHTHSQRLTWGSGGGKTGVQFKNSGSGGGASESWDSAGNYIGYSGSGSAHNNMPPWYGVYMWRRTA